MKTRTVLVPAIVLGVTFSPALAEFGSAALLEADARVDLASGRLGVAEAAPEIVADSAARVSFASAGSHWGTVGLGVTPGFSGDSVGYNGTFTYSYFLIDGIEAAGELGGWYYDQDGQNAFGINPCAVLRWHFWQSADARTTVYGDAGIGFVLFTNQVPFDGTSFNFTPRLGFGITHQISDDGWRLQAGLRWNHVSNARISSDSENPSRDGPLLYFGVMFPF